MRTVHAAAIAAGMLVLGTGAGVFLRRAASFASVEAQAREGDPPRASGAKGKDAAFGDWIALGSGCRSRSAEIGDVEVEDLPILIGDPRKHAARFHMPVYHLFLEGGAADPRAGG